MVENAHPADDTTTQDPVVLSDITEEWHRVKPALYALCQKSPQFNLVPEEVFDACAIEAANLWVAPDGFVVTRFITDEYSGVKTLLLWVAATFDGGKDMGNKYAGFFEEVAKYTNCQYIEFWSSRRGMERYAEPHGYTPYYTAYRKSI